MNCRHVRPELADFVNGKLDETVRKSVAAHLETCERCRAEAEEFRELFGLLKTPAVARPSDAYWASVLPRIHERIDRQSAIAAVARSCACARVRSPGACDAAARRR